jgi:hypothetical protein
MVDLSIIILGYKMRGLIKTCIRNIKAQKFNIGYEIIVVDNASNDGTVEMLEKYYPNIKYIKLTKNVGFQAGNNIGIKQARAKNILIINPDITITDDSIEKMFNFLKEHPWVGAVGPKIINPDKTVQSTCRKFYNLFTPLYLRTIFKKTKKGKKIYDEIMMANFDHNTNIQVDWLQASCIMVKKEILQKINYFDERFFLYIGDMDLCKKIYLAGFKVYYLAQACVIHYFHQESAGGIEIIFNKKGRIHIKDFIKYVIKYYPNFNR